jgi:hypothetical protein
MQSTLWKDDAMFKIDVFDDSYNVQRGRDFGIEMSFDELSDLRRSLASILRDEPYLSPHLEDAEMPICVIDIEEWGDDKIGITCGNAWFNVSRAEAARLLEECDRVLAIS